MMANPWYRAWVGAFAADKLSEACLKSGLKRSMLIALWHALLESAAQDASASPWWLAALLDEPTKDVEMGIAAFEAAGLLCDGSIRTWGKFRGGVAPPDETVDDRRPCEGAELHQAAMDIAEKYSRWCGRECASWEHRRIREFVGELGYVQTLHALEIARDRRPMRGIFPYFVGVCRNMISEGA